MGNIIAICLTFFIFYSIICLMIALYGPTKNKTATFLWMFFLTIPVGIVIGLLIDISKNTASATEKTEKE